MFLQIGQNWFRKLARCRLIRSDLNRQDPRLSITVTVETDEGTGTFIAVAEGLLAHLRGYLHPPLRGYAEPIGPSARPS